ncbi:hypothetical protein PoB_004325500 [Plakobranchus ocellatus]|uniref:Uncharacterized protein n=1 Tax=Plakobranchus ocellatus TaxID=259542 RepID=A0AAV4B845_9GAST|nr:hypothetical protein PoB_004325500 [Plakobranchus ocellatus]
MATWILDETRLVCRHPRLGLLGELRRKESDGTAGEWFQNQFSCYVHFDNEIYTVCDVAESKSIAELLFSAVQDEFQHPSFTLSITVATPLSQRLFAALFQMNSSILPSLSPSL